ncbi:MULTISPECIES: 2TM domain-containing protein [Flavobacterium]|uniref:Histidine kinase n=1 Tax=Flavobacterium rakeshii TaxID=1038845 RepID=A0A6N8HES3_9FLAO|nr:2TM domain-containing protein [Flavobacterium rakeshii]MEE1898934.1 2TM domain-containing protein [Flavobacterium rakeshii]MUV04058.1 histidine kinase [Flavobacterium rakeshii]
MDNFYNKSEEERLLYRKARKKVKELRGFYYHLTCYLVIMPLIIFINLTFSPQFLWFFFSLIGWGLGLGFHAMEVFGYNPFLGRGWEERKMRELMEKERQERTRYE